MDYKIMLEQQAPDKTAIIEDGRTVTYRELLKLAEREQRRILLEWSGQVQTGNSLKQLYLIERDTILEELAAWIACQGSSLVPVIVAGERSEEDKRRLTDTAVPAEAVMGAVTSGTAGQQKILFRTYESWADFFPVQNRIFSMTGNTVLFAQGSLAFTGNLNLYLALFSIGGTVVCTKRVHPQYWLSMICGQQVDAIYLIPAKMNALCRIVKEPCMTVRQFVTGSQSFGRREAEQVKNCFPAAGVTLYYGSSEASYITYLRDEDMTEDFRLVGRAFPGVEVWIENDMFYVGGTYGMIGIDHPFCTRDLGSVDAEGRFYFEGRADDLLNVNGQKRSAYRIEQAIRCVAGIDHVIVMVQRENGKDILEACYEAEEELQEAALRKQLREQLSAAEIPRRFVRVECLPRTDSGKLVRRNRLLS